MNHDYSLYENKVVGDAEFPVQMFQNHITRKGAYFPTHWHEHFELHYVLSGEGIMNCNYKSYKVQPGNLVIFNSNELHEGISNTHVFDALVLIFDMEALFGVDSLDWQLIFQTLIHEDKTIEGLFLDIFEEDKNKQIGYKIAMKGKIYELITYLMRNYVSENLTKKESVKRNRDLNRLNIVLQYIHENYSNVITNKELSELINLSEFRFCHLFKETVGQSPANYIIQLRLKKAYKLLQKGDMTIAEVSHAVGFNNFNNFGRLFRNYYGFAPSKVMDK